MTDSVKHPTLDQFRRDIEQRVVTQEKADAFNKWRNNPKKCTGAVKEAADKLWSEYESLGASARAGLAAQSSRAQASPTPQNRGSGST
jgi:hypothetical protein